MIQKLLWRSVDFSNIITYFYSLKRKVYIPTIREYVPLDVTLCLQAFMDFCYIVRANSLLASDIDSIREAITRFHHYRQVFISYGVRDTISLPRQHAMTHFPDGVIKFGAPNGLDSSITESKHIEVCKQTWRRASRDDPLPQMLRSITWLDQLKALHRKLDCRRMLDGTIAGYTANLVARNLPIGNSPIELNHSEDEDEERNDCGPSEGPKVLSSIKLARERSKFHTLVLFCDCSLAPQFGAIQFMHDHWAHISSSQPSMNVSEDLSMII